LESRTNHARRAERYCGSLRPPIPMKTSTKLIAFVAAALVVAAATLLGGALAERGSAVGSAPGAVPAAADAALTGFATDGGAELPRLEAAVRARPTDVSALTELAFAYQQRWRETADASFLPRADEALRRARRLAPDDPLIVTGQGLLALTRHDFLGALTLGRLAVALAPGTARPYGVMGDALLELGRYREAFAAFDRMAALKPSLAAYARVAYARELLGRVDGAIAAMQLALDSAAGRPEPTAWTHVELGKLHFGRGELLSAERHYRAALAVFPGYPYAYDGLARVEAARGRLHRAVALERRAVQTVPLPQFVGELGDLLERSGRRGEAARQRRTLAAIDRLLAAGGIRTDLESTLYDVDHGVRRGEAVARARGARAARPSIYGDDLVGWALARTGRCEQALPWSQRALRLGTRDALLLFHRGMIERCLGRSDEARLWLRRAVELNPAFSTRWAPLAARFAGVDRTAPAA
jgi:tetratricopeptide (TPR) repeat protein